MEWHRDRLRDQQEEGKDRGSLYSRRFGCGLRVLRRLLGSVGLLRRRQPTHPHHDWKRAAQPEGLDVLDGRPRTEPGARRHHGPVPDVSRIIRRSLRVPDRVIRFRRPPPAGELVQLQRSGSALTTLAPNNMTRGPKTYLPGNPKALWHPS